MQPQDMIVKRIEERRAEDHDPFGFELSEYVCALDFTHAKPYLKDSVTEDDWQRAFANDESLRQRILGYLPFAWRKANNARGLSAMRSVQHFVAWTWLLGMEELSAECDADDSIFVFPTLERISEEFGYEAGGG